MTSIKANLRALTSITNLERARVPTFPISTSTTGLIFREPMSESLPLPTKPMFADGSTFPDLPAKNLTFTLMANATRIAEEAF